MINYNDNYYDELSDIIEDIDVESLKEGDVIKCGNCTLEPIITLTANMIVDSLENHLEERHSEDNVQEELQQITNVLKENIDFDKINSLLPKLWYPNGKEIVFTYEQIMNEINK